MNIANMSLGDGIGWGVGDGAWKSKEAIERRVEAWKKELCINKVFIRYSYPRAKSWAGGYRKYLALIKSWKRVIPVYDPLKDMPGICHKLGVEAYLYMSLFDEGWPLLSAKERKHSYHNNQHAQHTAAQTKFSYEHPEYAVVDRTGKKRQWGVLCLAYPEVRQHFIKRYLDSLKDAGYDGMFVCMRSQSKPAEFADQYGFNEPIRREYLKRYNRDILMQDFNLDLWRKLCGDYITIFLAELKKELSKINTKLGVGIPTSDYLGPPMGNTVIDWQSWMQRQIVDDLIVEQDSSRCPSMNIDLWPNDQGYGYIDPVRNSVYFMNNYYYREIQYSNTKLYISRQWDERSINEDVRLLQLLGVIGLIYSAFKHDNPEVVLKNDWRVKHT